MNEVLSARSDILILLNLQSTPRNQLDSWHSSVMFADSEVDVLVYRLMVCANLFVGCVQVWLVDRICCLTTAVW